MNATDYARHAGNLFVLPDTVMRIRELGEDETASISDIAELINYDPALSAQLLKLANSAMYSFEKEVDTTSKAIQVVGTNAVYDLALAYAVANAFKDVESAIIDLDKYWELSVRCALLAKHFAKELGCEQADRLFVTGLLHNIGELVMVQLDASMAERCNALTSVQTPLDLQHQCLGFCYADISAELLLLWNVPDEISICVRHQHRAQYKPSSLDEQIIQLCRVLAVDNVYRDIYPAYPHLHETLLAPLGLNKSDIEYALDSVNLQSMSVLALFNPSAFAIY